MKKFLFILSGAAFCFLASCSGGGMSSAAKKNMEAMQAVSKAFDSGDTSKINDYIAADFVDHSKGTGGNRDSLKLMIVGMHANSENAKTETKMELANDEYAAMWLRWTGTSKVATADMAAGPYDMNAIELARFKDGKAVEHWVFFQPGDMMKMMSAMSPNGAMPPANAPAPADTSAHK